jgi:hypothetical protein
MSIATDLKSVERNVYSQFGEDGIIEWVFSRIAPRHRICVEFGAWDGRKLSNTFNLVAHHGWSAIYIEADRRKFRRLLKTAAAHPAITPVCSLVTPAGNSSLDRILERQGVPKDFDLLSIDIDGNDYDVWEANLDFHPTMVVIEYNATFPPGYNYIDRGGHGFIGSSAASLSDLASRKGYGLLGATLSNLLFLREPYFSALGVKPQPSDAAIDQKVPCHVFFNYAGEIVFSDGAVARKLRNVTYAQPLKSWIRRVLSMPTFYALGEKHRDGGAIMKFSRWIASLARPSAP